MTWTRIKRAAAEHPAVILSVTMMLCPLAVAALVMNVRLLEPLERAGILVVVAAADLLATVLVGGTAFWLATARARAGLSARAVEEATGWGLVFGAALPGMGALALGLAGGLIDGDWPHPGELLLVAFGAAVVAGFLLLWPLVAAVCAIGVAQSRAARKIDAGQWETTGGMAGGGEDTR